MASLKKNIPVILFILFELIVGILLLVNPEAFTKAVIIFFGIVMVVIGIVYIIRYLREKNTPQESKGTTLVLAIIALVIGLICIVLTNVIIGIFAMVAILYGVILIISGIFKIKAYHDSKKEGYSVSFLMLLSAVIAVVLGVIIVINPFTSFYLLWMFIGLALIIEAVIDLIAVIMAKKKTAQ